MSTLAIAPLQWSDLSNIDDVDPINDGDTDCLKEIRDVLKRHGKMQRFGVALLHSHFDIADDEILLETCNSVSRTLVSQPVKQTKAGANKVGTIWMLQEGNVATMAWCKSYCRRQFFGHGTGHRKLKN